MNNCCERYGFSATPKTPKDGKFKELHICPDCGRSLEITFEKLEMLGGVVEYAVISVNPVKK